MEREPGGRELSLDEIVRRVEEVQAIEGDVAALAEMIRLMDERMRRRARVRRQH